MLVVKATALVVISHALRMVANLVILKLIAIFIGPTGLGLLGNLMSLTTMAAVFAGGGISNGIAKYVAQYQRKPIRQIRFINSAITYGTVFSFVILVITTFAAKPISRAVFGNEDKIWLVPCFGLAQIFCFIGTASIAVANGLSRTDIFAKISITAYLSVIPVAYLLIISFGITGAAIALLAVISSTAWPAIYYLSKSASRKLIRFKIAKDDLRNLSSFSVMLLVSATLFPCAEIFIRNQLSSYLGYEQSGIWQALNKFSGAYIGFFTVFLSTHYMPKLAAISDKKEIVALVYRYIFGVSLAFLGFAIVVYLLRNWIVLLLFSDLFLLINDLIIFQLIGDFFRLLAYVIGFLGVAKAAVKIYIYAEIFQTSLYAFFSWLFLGSNMGIDGVLYGYILTYIIYFGVALLSLFIYSRNRQ